MDRGKDRGRAVRAGGIAAALPVLLMLLLVAAVTLRLIWSLDEPLWLDEAYSAYAADKGFRFLWHVVPTYETHPPFYYSLLRLWTLVFGNMLAGYRSLGFACGLTTLPVMGIAGRDLARALGLAERPVAWSAVALAGFSVALVAMTREVRPYPVMILVYAGSMVALIRIGAAARDGRLPRGAFIGYLCGLALMLWLHNLGALYAGAMGLALLALIVGRGLSRRDWGMIVAGHALVALIWLPALWILMDQAPTWVHSTWLKFRLGGLRYQLPVLYAAPTPLGDIAALLLWLMTGWRLARMADGARFGLALFALATVPVIGAVILSLAVTPVFILRIMTACAVPALLLLAVGVAGQRGRAWRVAGYGLGVMLAGQMALVDINDRRAGAQQDWYKVVEFLRPRFRPGDVLLAYPNEGALPLVYALRDRHVAIAVRPVPTPVPSIGVGGWYPTGSRGVVSLPRDRLGAIAQSPAVARARTVWLLRLGSLTYDKGDMFLTELSRGRHEVAYLERDPIDLVALRRVEAVPAPGGASTTDVKR